MLPFMCDDDESRGSVVEAYTERQKSFGETKHIISCRDCKKKSLVMAFSRTLLALLNFGVWPCGGWHALSMTVLVTEFLSCFLGNRFCIPLCKTGFSDTDKGAAAPLCCSLQAPCRRLFFSAVTFFPDFSFWLPVIYFLSLCLYHSNVYISSLSHTFSSSTSIMSFVSPFFPPCNLCYLKSVSVLYICVLSAASRPPRAPPLCLSVFISTYLRSVFFSRFYLRHT